MKSRYRITAVLGLCFMIFIFSGLDAKRGFVKQMVTNHHLSTEQIVQKMGGETGKEWVAMSNEAKHEYLSGYTHGLAIADMMYKDVKGFDLCPVSFDNIDHTMKKLDIYFNDTVHQQETIPAALRTVTAAKE